VQGGAGTVGYLAVQLAKWGGARVIATCSPRDAELVRGAGADAVLDYADSDLARLVLEANGGKPVETIVETEFGFNINTDTEVIAPNGRIAAYGSAAEMSPTFPFYPLLFKAVTIDIILIYLLPAGPREQAITRLHHALGDGALRCPVDSVLPLAETAKAHALVEVGNRTGAVLLDCRG
jgi:NADPH2:quinone reductase